MLKTARSRQKTFRNKYLKMIITHSTGNVSAREKNADFLLVNKRGSYFCLTNDKTNYQGLNYLYNNGSEWSYYKTIENISLEQKPREIINHLFFTERKNISTTEKFFFLNHGLVYDVQNYDGWCFIEMDFRDIFDYDDKGRFYSIKKEEDIVIVEYTKHADDSLKKPQKSFFLAIKNISEFEKIGSWAEKNYSYDAYRGCRSRFWVYSALKFKIKRSCHVLFSFGETEKEAIKNIESLEKNKNHLIHLEHTYSKHLKTICPPGAPPKIAAAFTNSLKSLENLILNLSFNNRQTTGIFAGLPWFFQFWSRDQLISLKSLMLVKKFALCKIILFNLLDSIMENGRIQNRIPFANLGTADGTGWLFKRIGDFLDILEQNKEFKSYLSKRELDFIAEKLEYAIQKTQKNFVDELLVWNNPKETWMDTEWDYDKRDGKRIEIQALWLNMLELMVKILKKTGKNQKNYKDLLNKTLEKTRQIFFKQGILYDGENDPTIRPNVFMAYYIYPGLLSKNEWKNVFAGSLEKLWLEWGGVASIDRQHKLFSSYYSGQNNKSYHRGDSWLWVNNIAAISLYEVDKRFFKAFIEKILDASVEDNLFKGFIGHCSELSSAAVQDASGCWCQSWSSATLIELAQKLYS